MKGKLLNYIEEHKDELFESLCAMIRINTENDGKNGTEKPLALYLENELSKLGIESDVYSPDEVEGIMEMEDYLPGRNLEERTNITGKIKGKSGKKALMLAGHLDTMPIGDLSLWTVPPTDGIIKEGRIWGRGACDDKYALATWLFIAKALKELGIELENDLYLTGYVDEEHGGGDGALACCIKYPSDLYLNMDCKKFQIWHCASCGQQLEIIIRHKDEQDSCQNVIEGLEIVKGELLKFKERRKEELDKNPYYHGTIIPNTAMRILRYGAGIEGSMNIGRVRFVYYSDKTSAEIKAEYSEMFEKINSLLALLCMEISDVIYDSRLFRYGELAPDDDNIKLLQESALKASGRELKACGSCLSDLSLFLANTDKPAFSFGIGRDFNEYGGAHLPDEFIECDVLAEFAKIIGSFVLDWDEKNK